jgi:two-component system CheB/CheR fusion protein
VKRLSELLGHQLRVRSWPGRGSVFSIDVPVIPAGRQLSPNLVAALPYTPQPSFAGNILLVEDDPDIRQLLQTYLSGEGHHVLSASDGATALSLIATTVQLNLVITDYNLPGQMSGVALISALRAQCKRELPAIIITGDISGAARRDIADHGCVQLNKPMKLSELTATIQNLRARPAAAAAAAAAPHTIFVVDDDAAVRSLLGAVFEADGYRVKSFGDCESFLKAAESDENACLLLDEHLPGMSGFALLETLAARGRNLPAIMITGQGDVKMAVRALRAGVIDFIEKPADTEELRSCVARALKSRHVTGQSDERVTTAMAKIALLTGRQREIMDRVLAGEPSKNIACDLGISQRTVESHRASIMTKTGARSIPALVRLAMTAEGTKADYPPVDNIGET